MTRLADALAHLDGAIAALTMRAIDVAPGASGIERAVPTLQFTLGEELDRIERAMGPKGSTVFSVMADNIREAVIEIEAARLALGGVPS